MNLRSCSTLFTFCVLACCRLAFAQTAPSEASRGILPIGSDGKALNLDFETGTLKDWTAEGRAFARQPIEGDTVAARRSDMKSEHQGKFWVGSFEREGDTAQGTLTSVPFAVNQPWASFLIAGGTYPETCVELVRTDTQKAFLKVSGDQTETLKRVIVDLKDHLGKEIFIRIVDAHSGGWGHVNFDDFRLHTTKPDVPARDVAPAPDVYAHAGLTGEEAAKAMTVPEGFKVTLFAGEPDVVQPIAMTIDERGRLWVAEAYSYPRRVPDDQAKDRILIFEDTNNDGTFDSRKVFADKLNLISGMEVGFGGVWLASSPQFLFIPDKNGDDVPDGPPQVLLDGWGLEDTHETANSFIWGPDGWLYGCHGVFTHSKVGKPGTPEKERVGLNAGIWRYHPTKHIFERFAEGTSNPWGVDFDPLGHCFIEACVIPHLYNMIQGGRFERQGGSHFNPYTYDDIKTIADHRHYLGANPHGGNGRSDSLGGGHAHAGLLIYNGGLWPAEYQGSLFMNNVHGARMNRDVVTPKGSGFVGSHRPDFLLSNDAWSQMLYMRSGPDGNVYVIDWYDKNQCHRNELEMHDRSNGRIFKISYGDANRGNPRLHQADEPALISALMQTVRRPFSRDPQLIDRNDWTSRTARRLLQQRGLSGEGKTTLANLIKNGLPVADVGGGQSTIDLLDDARRLQALWTLHVTGNLSEDLISSFLKHNIAHIRAWTIQLACENKNPPQATLDQFASLAKNDASPVVRLYLASALQRIPLAQRWPIIEHLVTHSEDADDFNLPLMYWYAAEPLATINASRALALAADAKVPHLLSFMTRRVTAIGTAEAITLLVDQLAKPEVVGREVVVVAAMNEALQGRRQVEMPKNWPTAFDALIIHKDIDTRTQAVALGVTFGDARALNTMREALNAPDLPTTNRLEALAALLKARDPKLPQVLHTLLRNATELRPAALRALAAFDHEATPAAVLAVYSNLSPAEKRDALATLASRPAYAQALLSALADEKVARTDFSADLIRNLRNLKNEQVNKRIAEVWGMARETPADRLAAIEKYRSIVRRGYSDRPDPLLGRAVFAKTCAQCHTLFGVGTKIGPELTGSNRADLDYILTNVLDPSALVGKEYQATIIATADGRTLTGIVQAEDRDAVTLVTATETIVIPKTDIEERKLTVASLMPEDQLNTMSDHEVRSLVAYLASPNQVPSLATPENVNTFFNEKDLTGWRGDPTLWSVENGEIVGKTTGLDHNEFLIGDLAAADFRFACQVRLAKNEGNSGVQFRSEPLPDGTVRGYQADIGVGWWGKLYEEEGRGLLWDKSGESFVKPGEWNTYEVLAVGSKVVTKINGHECVNLDDPLGAKRGVFALQLHSGGPTDVRFKDLRIELNPTASE
jgi:putative membrane-bound dehydrogenase-like protein